MWVCIFIDNEYYTKCILPDVVTTKSYLHQYGTAKCPKVGAPALQIEQYIHYTRMDQSNVETIMGKIKTQNQRVQWPCFPWVSLIMISFAIIKKAKLLLTHCDSLKLKALSKIKATSDWYDFTPKLDSLIMFVASVKTTFQQQRQNSIYKSCYRVFTLS